MGRQCGKLGLTRAQSKSTASSMSSWWPILDTPKSSSSWWVIRSSWSPPTFSLSKVLMYCCRQSSRPEGNTQHDRKTFTTARQGKHFVCWRYQIFRFISQSSSCQILTCIKCSNVLMGLDIVFFARICAVNLISLCVHRLCFAAVCVCVKQSDEKSDRFLLINTSAAHFQL